MRLAAVLPVAFAMVAAAPSAALAEGWSFSRVDAAGSASCVLSFDDPAGFGLTLEPADGAMLALLFEEGLPQRFDALWQAGGATPRTLRFLMDETVGEHRSADLDRSAMEELVAAPDVTLRGDALGTRRLPLDNAGTAVLAFLRCLDKLDAPPQAAEAAPASPPPTEGDGREDCYDLSRGEPGKLAGVLSYVVFPGPPNYDDIGKGDAPDPAYLLRLDREICLTGDAFAAPEERFSEVHLVPTDQTRRRMRQLVGADVEVELAGPYAAHTAHHHAPLVAEVMAVRPLDDAEEPAMAADEPEAAAPEGEEAPPASAAATVAAFYQALGRGDGQAAASLVIPEKRSRGPFSAREMTRFYGSLDRPLRLLDVDRLGDNRYLARYTFRTGGSTCDGRAQVTTVNRDGRNLIRGIRALSGC